MPSRAQRLTLLAVAALALGACANEDYEPASARIDLEAAGLTDDQARCVTAGLDEQFRDERLSARATPTQRERERFDEVLATCNVTPDPDRPS